jgi:hypothetical protein
MLAYADVYAALASHTLTLSHSHTLSRPSMHGNATVAELSQNVEGLMHGMEVMMPAQRRKVKVHLYVQFVHERHFCRRNEVCGASYPRRCQYLYFCTS